MKAFFFHIVVCIFMSSPVHTHAQLDENNFRNLSTNNGLSDNTITAICQDEQGYIWVGTHDGLNRYDGSQFKKFFKTNDPASLPNNKILRLKNLGNSKLGIATNEGFQVLNTKTYEARNYIIGDSTAFFIYCNRGWDITEIKGSGYFCATATGFYWFGYNGNLVWRYDHYSKKDMHKPMRFGREVHNLPGNKVLTYAGDHYKARIFDVTAKRFLTDDEAAGISEYLPPKISSTWRTIAYKNNWTYKTARESDSIYAYSSIDKRIVASPLPLGKKEYGWPGRLYPANGNNLVQACYSGGFVVLQTGADPGNVHTDGKKYFAGYICNYILVDNNSRYWIGTEKGLFVQQFLQPAVKQYPVPVTTAEGAKAPNISGIYALKDALLLCGPNQYGIKQVGTDSVTLKKIILLHPDPTSEWNKILFISSHINDTLWLGSRMGLGWYDTRSGKTGMYKQLSPEGKPMNFIQQHTDSHGNTWFSVIGDSKLNVVKYDQEKKSFERLYTQQAPYYFPLEAADLITEDAFGNIWIGHKGITRFNYSRQRFDTVITVFAGHRKFEDNVLSLSADKYGNLWIATAQNGLLRYDIKNNSYRHFTVKDGLSSEFILSLSQCLNNTIFIATRNKLNLLNVVTGKITVYSQADGVPESSITTGFSYDSARNKIWMGYHDVIAGLTAGNNFQNGIPQPKLTIAFVVAANNSTFYFPKGSLYFGHQQNNLSVGISSFDFEIPENNRLLYRLHPGENWRNNEHSNTIFLDNLSPGKYQLEVMLESIAARWPTQIQKLEIIVKPPFWKTGWFLLLGITALATLAFSIYKNKVNNIRYKANQDKLLGELEMKALHTQMNPHFTFNGLNSIKEMILSGEKEKASKYLSTFAQLLRDTLEESASSFTTLEHTISQLERYISIEQLRFENFHYSIHTSVSLPTNEIKIPPMLLQPLVENAIWHGLQSNAGEKRLQLSFIQKGNILSCMIDDNGIGIKQSMSKKIDAPGHQSIAISNINKRIELLNKKFSLEYKLDISDKTDLPGYRENGTVAVLTIPIDIE
jgi:ligand-binding sensor domain-containing protein